MPRAISFLLNLHKSRVNSPVIEFFCEGSSYWATEIALSFAVFDVLACDVDEHFSGSFEGFGFLSPGKFDGRCGFLSPVAGLCRPGHFGGFSRAMWPPLAFWLLLPICGVFLLSRFFG